MRLRSSCLEAAKKRPVENVEDGKDARGGIWVTLWAQRVPDRSDVATAGGTTSEQIAPMIVEYKLTSAGGQALGLGSGRMPVEVLRQDPARTPQTCLRASYLHAWPESDAMGGRLLGSAMP